MNKTKVTHYINQETYQILIDLVHRAKSEGNKNESQSSVIEKALIVFNAKKNNQKINP